MNAEEFAFVNQQLAAMLRENLPLEGSLKQLCATMERGKLRDELALLEADLAGGTPLSEAITRRRLPEFYVRLVSVGARGQRLPEVLTLLADYYRQTHGIWSRLQGLMVYPAILLVCSFLFSLWLGFVFHQFGSFIGKGSPFWWNYVAWNSAAKEVDFASISYAVHLWLPTLLLGGAALLALLVTCIAPLRRELHWRLPGFKQASLARVSAALAILLRGGSTLREALPLVFAMEQGTAAGKELRRWNERCAEGHAKFQDIAAGSRIFPPMFLWLVAGAGEDLALGFERAAETYRAQAARRTEVLVQAALPASMLFLGLLVLSQVYPMVVMVFKLPRHFF
jgi:type IV pilus assembly protein PilC